MTRPYPKIRPLARGGERREGDYVLAVGGRHGVVYYQGHWQKFECSICLHNQGILVRRIGTNDSPWARKILYQVRAFDALCQANPKHR